MSEATIYNKMRNLLIPYFILYGIITLTYYIYFPDLNKEYSVLISILAIIGTIYLIRSFFGTSKFKGVDRTYVVGPDLAILREEDIVEKVELEEGNCAVCSKHIYKPFLCDDCKQYFCGEHYLPGEHTCNRDEEAPVFKVDT